jgi:hypothetical protein
MCKNKCDKCKDLKLKLRQIEVNFTNYRLREREGFDKLVEENNKLKKFTRVYIIQDKDYIYGVFSILKNAKKYIKELFFEGKTMAEYCNKIYIDDLTIACWFIDKAEKYQECESYIYVKDLFSSETNS